MTAYDDESLFNGVCEDDFEHTQKEVYEQYKDKFISGSSHPYRICSKNAETLIIDDSLEMRMLAITMLDFCMESESLFPGTFWLECMRILTHHDLASRMGIDLKVIFNSFLSVLMKFNDLFPLTLPSIVYYELELRTSTDFYARRTEAGKILAEHAVKIDISLRFDLPRVSREEPQWERDETDTVEWEGSFD